MVKDISGKRYGKLTVSHICGRGHGNRIKWHCDCDCGGFGEYYKNQMDSGARTHCGCDANNKPNLKHGLRYDPRYSVWSSMINRCENKNNQDYHNYGGRGISVCKLWKDDIHIFINDMGDRPDGHSIDRIDNDGDYEPNNCRWADNKTQLENRRTTIKMDNGESITSFAKRKGISPKTIYMRKRRGWSDDEIRKNKRKAKN